MRGTTREPERDPAASRKLLRLGGIGAVLAGVLFVAWGYLDQEYAPLYFYYLVHVLGFIVPLLFTVALATLYARFLRQTFWLGKIGIILTSIGSSLGIVDGLVIAVSVYTHNAVSGRILRLLDLWTPTLFTGLLLSGLAFTAMRSSRSSGILLLTMGVFGWGYYVTDSHAILEARAMHVGFGLLFSLGWVALGLTHWLEEP
jgi:hypothetical protein